MILVARLENFKLWRDPIYWGLLFISALLLTLLFYRLCVDYLRLAQEALGQGNNKQSLSTDILKPLCSWAIVILAVFLPIFTTYAFSQDFKQKTSYLWATSAFTASDIVLGKFLALLSIVILLSSYVFLLFSTLSFEATLNWGTIFTSLLAVFLMGCCFISFGLFVSSIIPIPLLAAGLTLLGNLFWLLLEWLDPFPTNHLSLSQALSLLNHSYYLLSGLIHSKDIVFFLLFSAFWLIVTQRIVGYKLGQG